MIKAKLTALLLCPALVLSLTACSNEPASEEATAEPTEAVSEITVSPEAEAAGEPSSAAPSVSVSCVSESLYTDDGATLLLDFSCTYPGVFWQGHEEVSDAVNAALTEQYDDFVLGGEQSEYNITGKENYLAAAKESFAAYQSEGNTDSFTPYALQRETTVTRLDGNVLSLVYDDTTDMGGAHGYTGRCGYSYDMQTGDVIALEDLLAEGKDSATFLTEAAEQLADLSRRGEYYSCSFYDGYEEQLSDLLRAGNWYFSDEGLVVIANPYEIAPYADGLLEFTLTYDWLRYHDVSEKYLPEESTADGTLTGEIREDAEGAAYYWDNNTNATGSCVWFTADGAVENISVHAVSYAEYSNVFSEGGTRFSVNRLEDGESICIQTWIPDVMPNLSISWQDAEGEHTSLIAQSGMDGSLVLMNCEEYTAKPIDISGKSSYCYDIDNDGTAEEIAVSAADNGGISKYSITVDGETLSDEYMFDGDRYTLWICDLNGDGICELLFSCDPGSDDYFTCGWHGDTLQPIEFVGLSQNSSDENTAFGYVDGSIEFSFGTAILESWSYQLGTYGAFLPLAMSDDGDIQPAENCRREYRGNTTYLTVKKSLPVTMDDGSASAIEAGEKILLTGTDGTNAFFRTEDGRTGFIPLARGDSGWTINGEDEQDFFDFLPYAG